MHQNVLIAESHPVILAGLQTLLADSIKHLYTATSGRQAIESAFTLRPTVLILNCCIASPSASQVVETLRQVHPSMPILIYSALGEASCLKDMVRRGVTGYILQTETKTMLLQAIEAVSVGEPWFSPCLLPRLLMGHHENKSHHLRFTNSEWQVLHGIALGHNNRTIAEHLCLREQVVKNYTTRIYKKLGVASRSEAMVKISTWNFITEHVGECN